MGYGSQRVRHQPRSASPLSRLHPLLPIPSASFHPQGSRHHTPATTHLHRAPRLGREEVEGVQASLTSGSQGLHGTQDSKVTPALAPSCGAHPTHVALHSGPWARPAPSFSPVALTLATVWPGPHCPRTWGLT